MLSHCGVCNVIDQGESGEAVFTSMEEKEASEQAIREYGFNMVASDKIAMNRTIPDTRMTEYVIY